MKNIPHELIGRANIYNVDCVKFLKKRRDAEFNLAIVDVPYGIGAGKGVGSTRGKKSHYTAKDWDSEIPKIDYWNELFRVSKNQIIWGGNYMTDYLRPSRGWIYWQKLMGGNYADGELAWTSFDTNLREYTKRSDQGNRFHPTQKPVALYEWLLKNYAKEGDTILDTHFGSGSIAIATNKHGFDLTACELDEDYFKSACERIRNAYNQPDMFTPVETKPEQGELL